MKKKVKSGVWLGVINSSRGYRHAKIQSHTSAVFIALYHFSKLRERGGKLSDKMQFPLMKDMIAFRKLFN